MRWSGMVAMARKELRQLGRDHRTVALLLFQPLLMLVVFGYAASFDLDELPVGVMGAGATELADRLPDRFTIDHLDVDGTPADAEALLRAGDHAAVFLPDTEEVLVDGAQLFAARGITETLAAIPGTPEPEVRFNPDLETPPVLVPALAGIILAFVGTVATSLGVVRERQAGTMEQLAMLPLRPADVLVGKLVPYLALAVVNLAAVMTVAVWLFDVPFAGSVWLFALGALLFLIVTLALGLLVSTVSQNQGQAMQLAIMLTLPQILLSGAIFPIDAMPLALRGLAALMPLTWFVEIARGVMLRAATFGDVSQALGVLAALGAAALSIAVLRVRGDLLPTRPGGPSAGPAPREPVEAVRS